MSYLEALNKIFERSILGKKVWVFDANGTTLQRMEEGFMFFSKWAKENQDEDEDRKSFLASKVSIPDLGMSVYGTCVFIFNWSTPNMIIYDPTITCTHTDAIDLGFIRIMWFGFRGLVQDFTTTNPEYHINPK